jgi:subtilisin family serine protease
MIDAGSVNYMQGLEALWAETPGDPEIRVAILDGPVELQHPAFSGARLRAMETLVPGTAGYGPATVHGTHIASIIFGQPGGPVAGLAPACTGIWSRSSPTAPMELFRPVLSSILPAPSLKPWNRVRISSALAPDNWPIAENPKSI